MKIEAFPFALLSLVLVGEILGDPPKLENPVVFQRREVDRTGKAVIYGKLWIMEADGSQQRQITFGTTYDEHPSLYSDLEHVLYGEFFANAYLPEEGARLVKINIYTGEREIVAEEFGAALHHATISPINDLIAYHQDRGERVSQWTGLGEEAREIPFRATNGVLAPDGLYAMHEKNPEVEPRQASIILVSTSKGRSVAKILTDDQALHRRVAISPDGSKIAWQSNQTGSDDEIFVAGADGSNPRNLTATLGNDGQPWYSRDGEWIVFESDRLGNMEIWRMRADGSQQEQLTEGKGKYVSSRPRM